MGASWQMRRAADREQWLRAEVDPELGAEEHRLDLERAKDQAAQRRRALGMKLNDKQRRRVEQQDRDMANVGCGCLLFFVGLPALVAWAIVALSNAASCTSLPC